MSSEADLPDHAYVQFEAVKVAYAQWKVTEKYRPKPPLPQPATLVEVLERIIPIFRKGAQIYIDNPKYADKKAKGLRILEALKDADPAALIKKFKGKAEREIKKSRGK
jgi:hypothetical protein